MPLSRLAQQNERIRRNMILNLQEMLEDSRKNAHQAKKPRERREWARLTGYLAQRLNLVLRDLDIQDLNQQIEELRQILKDQRETEEPPTQ